MVVEVTSSDLAITAAALAHHACRSLKILAVALVTDSP
jgi:hypothetical protein